MSDDKPLATGVDVAALRQAAFQFEKSVDAVYANAIAIARLIGLAPDDVPRLCVSAACRFCERMLEQYMEIKDRSEQRGETQLTERHKERLQNDIRTSLVMLANTLSNGLMSTHELAKAAAVELPKPQ